MTSDAKAIELELELEYFLIFLAKLTYCALFGSSYNDASDTSSQNANIFGSPGSQQLLPLMNPLGPASQGYRILCLAAVGASESLPRPLIFQYFAHKKEQVIFHTPPHLLSLSPFFRFC